MAVSGWGGGIELAAFSNMMQISVHVYERNGSGECRARNKPLTANLIIACLGFKRVSAFDIPGAEQVIMVLYQGQPRLKLSASWA